VRRGAAGPCPIPGTRIGLGTGACARIEGLERLIDELATDRDAWSPSGYEEIAETQAREVFAYCGPLCRP